MPAAYIQFTVQRLFGEFYPISSIRNRNEKFKQDYVCITVSDLSTRLPPIITNTCLFKNMTE